MNEYCMFKGKLINAAPFVSTYVGSPHYVINVQGSDEAIFKIVVNSASTQVGEDGNDEVYSYVDLNFADPVTDKLAGLGLGLYTSGFPLLDYWQDRSLLDLHRMRPIPYADVDGKRADVNDIINGILSIDTSQAPESIPYDSGKGEPQPRDFYPPREQGVVVYGFGFLFQPQQDGLHETHMNQGNPRGPHWKENGAFQDGAVIVQRASGFAAIFTAFQTQYLPTDSKGFPVKGARPLPEFVLGSN
ncbi:YukJ family protein [Paraburkholderia sp. IMGN_8]|uniref:YukJ family protein n=1 Tax=Paraburkholderia sp. IMGN_8 TaxID=3136564 RepID=UPI003100DF03